MRYPCAVVSVVGRQLRNALSELGSAMRVLRGVPVHMISEAAEDLNLSFVVDEEHADKLVRVSLIHDEMLRVFSRYLQHRTSLHTGLTLVTARVTRYEH